MFNEFKRFSQERGQRFYRLSKPLQILVLALLLLLPAALLLWLFDKLIVFFIARSYVDEIALVFDLNEHLSQALALIVFVTGLYFFSRIFSFSKTSRLIGSLGLVALLIAHALFLWQGTKNQYFEASGKALKCYVLSREGEVRYLERANIGRIDSVTGRVCREVTPEMKERLQQYIEGKRPERIYDEQPYFFDPRTGEPIVWFWKGRSGVIELFNLMGFHPETGEELQPVTRDVVDEVKEQVARKKQEEKREQEEEERKRRPPERIDPDTIVFFDPVTGEPRVWFWHGQLGEYEFYDKPGYHPRTGEPLRILTRDDIAAWKRETELLETRRKQEQLRREQEQARREKEQQEKAEREERERQEELRRQQREIQSGSLCDEIAANPADPRKPSVVPGVPYEELKERAAEALDVCRVAITKFPSELRYRYQYARALGFSDSEKAIAMYRQLTRQRYPAAFDNLGTLLLQRKDKNSRGEAITVFKEGVQLGDPDSMVSLADLINRRFVPVPNPVATRYALLNRAAELGHQGAKRAVEQMDIEFQAQQRERASQQQQQQIILDLMGTILGGAIGHR